MNSAPDEVVEENQLSASSDLVEKIIIKTPDLQFRLGDMRNQTWRNQQNLSQLFEQLGEYLYY